MVTITATGKTMFSQLEGNGGGDSRPEEDVGKFLSQGSGSRSADCNREVGPGAETVTGKTLFSLAFQWSTEDSCIVFKVCVTIELRAPLPPQETLKIQ
eukprot:g45788.t1